MFKTEKVIQTAMQLKFDTEERLRVYETILLPYKKGGVPSQVALQRLEDFFTAAFEKLTKEVPPAKVKEGPLEVGDTVKVFKDDESYTTYTEVFKKLDFPNPDYGRPALRPSDDLYQIASIIEHPHGDRWIAGVVRNGGDNWDDYRLINLSALTRA